MPRTRRGHLRGQTDGAGAFGRLLQRHRQAAGLSQEELAERAGLSRRGISDLERGVRRSPYPETVRRLADCLDLPGPERAVLLAASKRAGGSESVLPVPLSSFVGRQREVEALQRLVGAARLVTLTGPGGVGKTRLALVVAADLQDAFDDGVWFVDLAPVSDPSLVPQAVASVVGVHEQHGRPMLATLVEALRRRRLLLILDNCEHLASACAELVDALLRACRDMSILATSREVLRISGETVWRVPPLGLPRTASADDVARSEAVQLFVARAAAVQPGLALTAHNLPTVAQLCQRLDGLPLAIELAAARAGTLGIEQLAALLGDRFRLLVRGSRTAAPRQQTLRATVEWSCALLPEPERQAFQRLAVFAGGWSLEAAQAVVGGDGAELGDVLDLLTQLVDKSLVVAHEGPSGEARYALLETLREYGWECLVQSDGADVVQRRHAEFFLALAESAAPELRGPRQASWMWRLEQESANLRSALRWSLERGEPELGLRLVVALWRFWWVRGYLAEGRRWLDELLRITDGGSIQTTTRARALGLAGVLAYDQGDYAPAAAFLEESLDLCRRVGDTWATAWTLHSLARIAGDRGDDGRAAALLEQTLELFRGLEDQSGTAWVLHELARVALNRADNRRATALHEESLGLFRAAGDEGGVAWTLCVLGAGAASDRDDRLATRLLEQSLTLFQDQGDRRGTAFAILQLGIAARDRGDAARAPALLSEALTRYRDLGDRYGVAQCLGELAVVACERRQPERAAQLFGAAQAIFEAIGGRLLPRNQAAWDPALARARAYLGSQTFRVLVAVGRSMAPDQAVAEALEVGAASAPAQRSPRSRTG